MGISEADLAFIASLGELPQRVCDLGDQDLICNNDAVFDGLGLNAPRRGKARDFWNALGRDYLSLDVVGNTHRFDLNYDSVPPEWKRFDLVTNCGTTEHVFDQANCFCVIHDLTTVGGVMYHCLPVAGYAAHGLFKYNLKFFERIAKANQYKILSVRVDSANGDTDQIPIDTSSAVDRCRTSLTGNDAGIRIAMRRTNAEAFLPPLDIPPDGPGRLRVLASRIKRGLLHQS